MEKNLFNSLNVSPEILKAIQDLEFDEMTQIQKEAIPLVLEGHDIIGRSSTGTGKTAAFGIPLVEMIKNSQSKNPTALILCPTRELALQVGAEIRKFAKYEQGISVATVFGGQSMMIQIRQLKRASVVVGTPGRIMDHMRRNTLRLKDIKMVVLDEADEMLNMGFYDDMKTILSEAPKERQTLLFSATMPKAILNLTNEFLKEPLIVAVDEGKMTIDAIEQYYYQVPQTKKAYVLKAVIKENNIKRALVFCNTKKMVDELVRFLNDEGIKSDGLHGDMRQRARTIVMNDYKSGVTDILVATDVAARGIDAKGIEAVINYDVPQMTEHYIHRIGRTARAGQKGAAYTLIANRNQMYELGEIEEYVKTEIIPKTLRDFDVSFSKVKDDKNKNSNKPKTDSVQNKDVKEVKAIEKPKVIKNNNPNKIFLVVNVGKKHRIAPNFIVGAIVEGAGISSKAIGKIDIYEDYSKIELSKKDANTVLETMKNSKIKNYKVVFNVAEDELVQSIKPDGKQKQKNFSDKNFPKKDYRKQNFKHKKVKTFKKDK